VTPEKPGEWDEGMTRPAPDHGHLHDQLGLYVLGALPEEERILVEAHLATCPDCRTIDVELGEVRAVMDRLTPDELHRLADEFSPAAVDHGPDRPAFRRQPAASTRPRGVRSTSRRRLNRLVLAGLILLMAVGVGVGVRLFAAPPTAITLAGSDNSSTTGAKMTVTVTGKGAGSHVDAHVSGLLDGRDYRLLAIDHNGHTIVVTTWLATDEDDVQGDLDWSPTSIDYFAVAQPDGSAVLTARISSK
jgi:hypothetical protein